MVIHFLCRLSVFSYYIDYYLDLLSFPTRRTSDLVYSPDRRRGQRWLLGRSQRLLPPADGTPHLAPDYPVPWAPGPVGLPPGDRKSTRLNSSHANISYAVFCLKKKMYRIK